jgi:hypothetical protein
VSWTLESAEERAAAAPATFRIPCLEVRERLVPGDLAKLIFVQHEPPAGERMWVRVVQKSGDGRYQGTLISRPATMSSPTPGDQVFFSAKHVTEVSRPGRDESGEVAFI